MLILKARRIFPAALLVVACLVGSPAWAGFSGGTGEPNDPYLIATVEHLLAVGSDPGLQNKHYQLVNDIDLDPDLPGGRVFDHAVIQRSVIRSSSPRGRSSETYVGFSGRFDGNGHVIRNLTVEIYWRMTSYRGLFESIEPNGCVMNLGIEDARIAGDIDRAGVLAARNAGTIQRCYATGSVMGGEYAGGLVGENSGFITDCYASGHVMSSKYSFAIGGLVGRNDAGVITKCYSTVAVVGSADWLTTGGLVGQNTGSLLKCLWDVDTSGIHSGDLGVGLTTSQMMNPAILALHGWANDPNWVVEAGRDYPRLAWEDTPGQIIPDPVMPWLDGRGTREEPYRIATVDQFASLGRYSYLWERHFVLVSDLDLSGIAWDGIGRAGWPFTGAFDGNGHVIRNLTIDMRTTHQSCLGLFRSIGPGGQIRNLRIDNVTVYASPSDSYRVGVLAGASMGSITNCHIEGNVGGYQFLGGLVGLNDHGAIRNCSANVNVSGQESLGGLVGSNSGGAIANCHADGDVTGMVYYSWYLGGLVGANSGMVMDSYATGDVYAGYRGANIGGLVGKNEGAIAACYATGRAARGLVGYNTGSTTSSFWDMNTSRVSVSQGGIGLTTAQLMNPEVLALNGWAGDPNWVLYAGHDYPRLAWEGTPGQVVPEPSLDWLSGSGTEEAPYIIMSVQQFVRIVFASILWTRHFVLASDLDLTGVDYRWIGLTGCPFTGSFQGDGHVIKNLTIDTHGEGPWELGLFGVVGAGGFISNLGIDNAVIISEGNSWYVGLLAGVNHGTIATSYAKGYVLSNNYVGGLVGLNRGAVYNCYATGSMTSNGAVGGLAGWNSGTVGCCYASSSLTSSNTLAGTAGGLIGFRSLQDENTVSNCFWDIEISGIRVSNGGAGLTAAGMRMASTFLDAGWDFVGETVNGTEDIWWILEGQDYPRLWWEAADE